MNHRLQCPLCRFEFEKTDTVCTHGCPLGRFCQLIRCPSCQYEFPEPTRPLRWLAKWWHPVASPPRTGAHPLTEIEEGQTVEFVELTGRQESRRSLLAVYGLVPGSRLTLQQKRPACIIRIGETELALEPNIARDVLVKHV